MSQLGILSVYGFSCSGKAIKAHKRTTCALAQNGPDSPRQDFSELGSSVSFKLSEREMGGLNAHPVYTFCTM